MDFFTQHQNIFRKLGLFGGTLLLVAIGSLLQNNVLKVKADVQVLLVSRTAIAFGDVFPGENLAETYTVALDTSANSAAYVTSTSSIPGLMDLCKYLDIKSIDSPSEPDTLANSTLTRPGDILDKWQVSLNTPGIQGQVSQDHDGGIVVQGGDYGCKITIVTQDPTRIVIIKNTVGGDGSFNFSSDLGAFGLTTASGTASTTFTGLQPGVYRVTEATSSSWQLSNLSCADPSNDSSVSGATATINVANQETVTCTFTNTKAKPGTIVICKQSFGGLDTFGFSGNLGSFNLQTQTGSGDAYCKPLTSSSSPSLVDSALSVFESGFGFGGSPSPQNGSADKIFTGLTPGSYTVGESTSSAWTLASLSCQDPTSNSSVSGNKASVQLDSGETVVCTFVNAKKGQGKISGTKFNDLDGAAVCSTSDPRLSGWTIYLDLNNNGQLDSGEPSTVTDSQGNYSFDNLPPGTYYVREVGQSGWITASPASGYYKDKITSTENYTGQNFGNFKLGSISGEKFEDKNGNGKKDSGEEDLANWTIKLLKPDGTTTTTTTDSSGNYTFGNLGAGYYYVTEIQQTGWTQKTANPAGITISSGKNVTGVNFGNKKN